MGSSIWQEEQDSSKARLSIRTDCQALSEPITRRSSLALGA